MNEQEKNNVPECVGVIMDGNRRWARAKGLPPLEGHRAGKEALKHIVEAAKNIGVRHLIFYTFSTENWNRSEEEVSYFMNLLREALGGEFDNIVEEGGRIRFIGDLSRLPDDLQKGCQELEERSKHNNEGTVTFALSYGGRAEILSAVNGLLATGTPSVDEATFQQALWTGDIPNPDIIIRTGGEKRLSNFLPWQSTYSELFFLDTMWPDFSKEEFEQVLGEYADRERRHGK